MSQTVLDLWNGKSSLPNGTLIPSYPLPNTGSAVGADGINIDGYTFAGPQPENQNTYLFKLDYNVTQNGNHRAFLRGNLQNDREMFAAQFQGESPSHVFRTNNKGIAAGYTAILSDTVINNFRYAFIREGTSDAGSNPYSYVGFWNLADPVSFARTTHVSVPLNQFIDDVTWMRGKHTLQFGGNGRIIDDNRDSNQENFFYGSSHPDWLFNGGIANTGQNLDPAISSSFPAVDSGFGYTYDAAIADVTGLVGSISAIYNQNKSGIFARTGSLIQRRFKSKETELYAQDAWHVRPNLQLTFGLRYSLLQPPYEANGNQVTPTPSLGTFFNHRAIAGESGYGYQPPLSFALSGQANGKQPYWNWDYKDLSPRFAFAYSPANNSGFLHKLFGTKGKSSIRGGYGLYFDHFGEGVVNTFDRQGSFGLSTFLENPAGVQTTDCVARFVRLTTIPATNGCPAGTGLPELPPQPAGGFPFTPPGVGANGSFAIAWGLDSGLKTPYSHVFDFSITREMPHQFVFEVTYVGRFGRRLLQEVDMATPENLRDPKSGMTYFQAATALVKLANANTNESAVKPIAYWENLFPAAAGGAGESGYAPGTPAIPTATQNIYDLYYANNPNATYALLSLDTTCFPACSTLGPYAYWDSQFSSLYSWRATGTSNYNGLQATLRRRVASLELDLNYTYSKSLDENSNAERVNEYEAGSNGATAVSYSGQVVNAWMPHQLYGPSDFDLRHQFNANWVYDLPFGRGKRFGSESSKVVDGILGGWEFSGLTRWTSGYPFSVDSYAFATDYEQDGRAVLLGAAPTTGTYIDSGGNPNVFKAGTGARSAFRFAYPGESGQRNNLRGPGYFGTDMSLAKLWRFGETQSIRLSWDAFNVTNSVRFDVGTIGNYLLYPQQLGEFTQTMTHPRVMQFGLL